MLRHSGRHIVHARSKLLGRYALSDAGSLFDLSGASLAQSLVNPCKQDSSAFNQSLMFCSPSAGFESPAKLEFQAQLLKVFDHRFEDALWGNSGSDAMEIALWAAELLVQNRHGEAPSSIMVREGGYHGNTRLCRSLSSRITPQHKLGSRVIVLKEHSLGTDTSRAVYTPFSNIESTTTLLDRLKQRLAQADVELPSIVVLEGFPTTGWQFDYAFSEYQALLEYCQKQGIVTVIDDVASGAFRHGRASSLMPDAAAQQAGSTDYIAPDILVLSKGLTSGAYPLSCCLLNQQAVQAIRDSGEKPLTFTYGLTEAGAELASAFMACHVDIFAAQSLAERTEFIRQLVAAYRDFLHAHQVGVEQTDTTIRLDLPITVANDIEGAMLQAGLWAYFGSASFDTSDLHFEVRRFLHLCPPFDIALDEQIFLLDQAFNILTAIIEV